MRRLRVAPIRSSLRGSCARRCCWRRRCLSTSGGIAAAEPSSPDTVGALIADVANANQKLQDLGAAVQTQQESVNKAIVDVQTARDNAATAQRDVEASQQAVKDANAAIAARNSGSTPSRRRPTSTGRRAPI